MAIREIYQGIVSNPDIFSGEAIIKGTRMPVAMVLDQLANGMPLAELLDEYDVSEEDVSLALAYAECIDYSKQS